MSLKMVANHAELMALVEHLPNEIVFVGFPGSLSLWKYDAASLESVGDGSKILKPTNVHVTKPGRWKFCALLVPTESFGHAAFTPASGVMRDPGRKHINILRLANNVADEETVTIGDDVYEFDRANDGVTAGRIAVTGYANDTPAAAGAALVDAINAVQGEEQLVATVLSANEILIENLQAAAPEALACSETLAGANNGWSAAAMYGGAAPAVKRMSSASRVPTAQEVALGKLRLLFDFTPSKVFVEVRVTATGVVKAWGGGIAIQSGLVTLTNGTDPDFAETDTIHVLAIE